MEMLHLLNEKNHYLKKFTELNQEALAEFVVGHFENMESFYHQRESLMEIIRYVDKKLFEASQMTSQSCLNADELQQMKKYMKFKDGFVELILQQDLQILACIDAAKSAVIRELQEINRSKGYLRKYKSNELNKNFIDEA